MFCLLYAILYLLYLQFAKHAYIAQEGFIMDKLSLLHPADVEPEYRQLPEETVHDLSFETI